MAMQTTRERESEATNVRYEKMVSEPPMRCSLWDVEQPPTATLSLDPSPTTNYCTVIVRCSRPPSICDEDPGSVATAGFETSTPPVEPSDVEYAYLRPSSESVSDEVDVCGVTDATDPCYTPLQSFNADPDETEHEKCQRRIRRSQQRNESTRQAFGASQRIGLRDVRVVGRMSNTGRVFGVALLDGTLFTLQGGPTGQIAAYRTTDLTLMFRLTVPGFNSTNYRNDLTSCARNRCLYVTDRKNSCIHRLSAIRGSAESTAQAVTTCWPVFDRPSCLSVTFMCCNVLVTFPEAGKLIEFTTDGVQVRVIDLCAGSKIVSPWHAVHLSDDCFVVCHGMAAADTDSHRVCVVNAAGRVLDSYGSPELVLGSKAAADAMMQRLNSPCHLAVDNSELIYVANSCGNNVLILTRSMDFVKELKLTDIKEPFRLYLDKEAMRLYIGQYSQLTVVDILT